jgi:flagellar assembly protein FliH
MTTQNINSFEFPQLEGSVTLGRTPAEVMANARAEAEKLREQVHAASEAAGYAEGMQRAQAQMAVTLRAAAGASSAIAGTRDELVETLTRQAGELALQIAEQIVAGAFSVAPERVIDVTRAALRRLSERHHVTVLVNPGDLELLAGAIGTLQAELGGIDHLDVQAERRIEAGGVLVRTTYGEIDASIAAQIESARELVQAALDGDVKSDPDPDAHPVSEGLAL